MRAAARDAASSTPLRVAARAGYVANGLVHVMIGAIVVAIALGARGEGDQAGALKAVAAAPLGFVVLWLAAGALAALGVWHGITAVLVRRRGDDPADRARAWGRRASEGGQAVVFLALGFVAGAVALGAKPDAEETAESASRGVLQIWGGPWLLGTVGLAVAGAGVAFVVMGVRRSFHNRVDLPDGGAGRALEVLGVVGFVAKGVALGVVGVLLVIAAVRGDADTAGGPDGAVDALLGLAAGPLLVGVVGGGFIAYGLFTVFRARYAKL